jgi:hypothetical protein
VEGVKQGVDVSIDRAPNGLEEKGPKTIRARAGIDMHAPEGNVYLLHIEILIKLIKIDAPF